MWQATHEAEADERAKSSWRQRIKDMVDDKATPAAELARCAEARACSCLCVGFMHVFFTLRVYVCVFVRACVFVCHVCVAVCVFVSFGLRVCLCARFC